MIERKHDLICMNLIVSFIFKLIYTKIEMTLLKKKMFF